MKRRQLIATVAVTAALIVTAPAAQAEGSDSLLTPTLLRLEAEGFTVTGTRKSWLGRLIVLANDGTSLREVVIHRSTGAVLSDRLFTYSPNRGGADPDKTPRGNNASHATPDSGAPRDPETNDDPAPTNNGGTDSPRSQGQGDRD